MAEMMLPDGRIIQVTPPRAKPAQAERPKRDRRKQPGEFAAEQPWLVLYLARGLVSVRNGQHVKQALKGVQCQAGKTVRYTSAYQEMDKKHAERILEQGRKLRSADFTHLAPCTAILGSGGFLRTSDFHQTLLCGSCQHKVRRAHAQAIKAASRAIALRRVQEEG